MVYRYFVMGLICLSLFASSASAALMIGQGSQQQAYAPVQQSFTEQVSYGDSYADQQLKEETTLSGLVARCILTSIVNEVVRKQLTGNNVNAVIVSAQLFREALVGAGLFVDSNTIFHHKDASWGQFLGTLDGGRALDFSDHVSLPRKIITVLGTIGVAYRASEPHTLNLSDDYTDSLDIFVSEIHFMRTIGCFISYILAELLRQQMIDKKDSPRIANIVSILASGAMNEVVKKVL